MEQANNSDNMVYMHDENGLEIALEFLDNVDYKGETYAFFYPNEGDEIIVLLVDEGDNGLSFVSVDCPHVLEVVFNIFKERHKTAFNFI